MILLLRTLRSILIIITLTINWISLSILVCTPTSDINNENINILSSNKWTTLVEVLVYLTI